jgi:hypothetical protein
VPTALQFLGRRLPPTLDLTNNPPAPQLLKARQIMPCYTAWYDNVMPGSPEFARAMQTVQAQLRAVNHIIDYYYTAFGLALPAIPEGVPVAPMRQPRAPKEYALRESICHHFACDGIDFMTLFDVATLLHEKDEKQRSYLAVIRPCSMLMKQHQDKFIVAYRPSANSE